MNVFETRSCKSINWDFIPSQPKSRIVFEVLYFTFYIFFLFLKYNEQNNAKKILLDIFYIICHQFTNFLRQFIDHLNLINRNLNEIRPTNRYLHHNNRILQECSTVFILTGIKREMYFCHLFRISIGIVWTL